MGLERTLSFCCQFTCLLTSDSNHPDVLLDFYRAAAFSVKKIGVGYLGDVKYFG